jgi:alkanesulfonate monooxygenase SsuD/methylene tetrahydromethanopterin reductase-like flavin-dependent oxidoreductase (luciferase family)
VPFAIAATGPAGMRLAARHAATWVTTGDRTTPPPVPPAVGAPMIAAQIARLEEACVDAGRDPSSIDRLVLMGAQLDEATASPQALADTIGAYAEAGITDLVVHWPRPEPPYVGDVATFEAAVAACVRAN